MMYVKSPSDDILGTHGLITIINIFICVAVSITLLLGTINPWFQFHRYNHWKADKSKPADTFQVKLNKEF
jgi:hypothetical protein